MTQALAKMRAENVNMEGTPILTTVTIDAVKSPEQVAEQSKQSDSGSSSAGSGGMGGMLGGFAKRLAKKKSEDPGDQKSRATFMTMTSEVLKVTTDVGTAVALPTGFQQK
jgi:hypothetical protein